MRYIIKEKIFTLANKFTIRDENEIARYEVIGKFFSIGKKLDIYDINGTHHIYIEQKILRLLAEYLIFREGEVLARVKRQFTFFKPRFTIDSKYGDFQIEGDILAHEFKILKDFRIIASVSKKWLAWSDTYTVDINDDEDQEFILALTIVLDQVLHDGGSSAGVTISNNN